MTFTDNEIVVMAKEACKTDVGFTTFTISTKHLQVFAEMVAAKEREACAKVCDDLSTSHTWEGCYANECASAIRARGEQA